MRYALGLIAIFCVSACHNDKAPYPSDWPTAILTMPTSMNEFEVLSSESPNAGLVTKRIRFKFWVNGGSGDAAWNEIEQTLTAQRWKRTIREDDRRSKREYENINSHLLVEVVPKKDYAVIACSYTHFAK